MYHIYYLYRVPSTNVDRFLRIVKQAAAIYRAHGAVASMMMRVTDAAAKYGCQGLSDFVAPGADEELFLGIDSFQDVKQFEVLMPQIDADPGINQLFEEIQQVVDLKSLLRWEAEDAIA